MDIIELSSVAEALLDRTFFKLAAKGSTPHQTPAAMLSFIMKQAETEQSAGLIPWVPEITYSEIEENGKTYGRLLFRKDDTVYASIPVVRNGTVMGRTAYDVTAFGHYRSKELNKFLLDNREKSAGGSWDRDEFVSELEKYFAEKKTGMEVFSGIDPNHPEEGWIGIRKKGAQKYTPENCYIRKLFCRGVVKRIVFAGGLYSKDQVAL